VWDDKQSRQAGGSRLATHGEEGKQGGRQVTTHFTSRTAESGESGEGIILGRALCVNALQKHRVLLEWRSIG
jgi:hypothetical protein